MILFTIIYFCTLLFNASVLKIKQFSLDLYNQKQTNEETYRICRVDVNTIAFNHASILAHLLLLILKTKHKLSLPIIIIIIFIIVIIIIIIIIIIIVISNKKNRYIIYYILICYHENKVPSRLSPQWLCGNSENKTIRTLTFLELN